MRDKAGIRGKGHNWFDEAIHAPVDDKNRVRVPAHFIEMLGTSFFIAAVPKGGHLALFPRRAWMAYVKPLLQASVLGSSEFTELKPFVGGLSGEVELDDRNRIVLPVALRNSLKGDQVVFVGAFDTVRIYDTNGWARFIRYMQRNFQLSMSVK
jgi:DNA-binding transcriptional regulator/RsmH inhibitor MraZ